MVDVEKMDAPADVLHVAAETGAKHAILEQRRRRCCETDSGTSSLKFVLAMSISAVFVVVGDGDAHAALLLAVVVERDAGEQPRLLERSVAQVAVQQAGRRVTGDEHVGIAIGVDVRRDRGEPIATAGRTNAASL